MRSARRFLAGEVHAVARLLPLAALRTDAALRVDALLRFAVERTLTINAAGAGGNATLLAEGDT